MFIVFEGLDGSGSSTQAKMLQENLVNLGHDALQTKEPTNDLPIGKLIRRYLQHEFATDPKALQLLFAADRLDHIQKVIKPAQAEQRIIISDRYFYSSIAFGSSVEVPYEWLRDLYKDFLKPDLVFLLKVSPAECIRRIEKRMGSKELFEREESLKQIWKQYEKILAENPHFHLIDAENQDKFTSANQILEIVKNNLKKPLS